MTPDAPLRDDAPDLWQSVSTAPTDGTLFLAWVNDGEHGYATTGYCMDDGWFIPIEGDGDIEVSHWQPLIPPKGMVAV
jgi:hypothetical protein